MSAPSDSTPSTGPSTVTTSSHPSTFDTQSPSSDETSPELLSQHSKINAWGQLVVIDDNARHDLFNDEYSVGRSAECNITFAMNMRPTLTQTLYNCCSKKHFRIYVRNQSTGRYVFLEDLSTNGTLVNSELVGKGRYTVIKSGDLISLVKASNRAYLFVDFNTPEKNEGIPTEVSQKYMFVKDIGRGACGLVKLAVRRTDLCMLACKCIDKSRTTLDQRIKNHKNESDIMSRLDHPCIIRISEVIETDDMICIFMELSEGGDLFSAVKRHVRLDEDHAKRIIYQMCLAVKYLHDNNVVHRDLKPENILLSCEDKEKQIVKVTDFGLSKLMESSSLLHTLCGTPYYLAPEIVADAGLSRQGYTKAVDCWSIGVMLFVCITGQPAFSEERKDMPLKSQILSGNYLLRDKYWENISQAKDLVQRFLTVDPQKRITIDEALKHEWFHDEPMINSINQLLSEERSSHTRASLKHDTSVCLTPVAKKPRYADIKENRVDAATPLVKPMLSSRVFGNQSEGATSTE